MNMDEIKKIQLAELPTPLQYMSNLSDHLGCGDLYIKRDDLTDVGLSGNKIRKLEYLVKDALDQGCNTLLTYGGPQTNHGRLTVAAAVKNGLKSILILRGTEPDYISGNLLLDKLMGADIYFTEEDPEEFGKKIISKYKDNGDSVYEIPIGGSNELGALGYINMVKELKEQLKEKEVKPKYIIVASGSMGTYAGMWVGAKYYGLDAEIVPISVNPETRFTEKEISEYINKISETYELGISCQESDFHLRYGDGKENYAGIAYNAPDRQTQGAIELLARTEAIFVDPCYTGKTFHGFVDHCSKNLKKDESAVFIHTGGAPALWTKEHLDSMQDFLK